MPSGNLATTTVKARAKRSSRDTKSVFRCKCPSEEGGQGRPRFVIQFQAPSFLPPSSSLSSPSGGPLFYTFMRDVPSIGPRMRAVRFGEHVFSFGMLAFSKTFLIASAFIHEACCSSTLPPSTKVIVQSFIARASTVAPPRRHRLLSLLNLLLLQLCTCGWQFRSVRSVRPSSGAPEGRGGVGRHSHHIFAINQSAERRKGGGGE